MNVIIYQELLNIRHSIVQFGRIETRYVCTFPASNTLQCGNEVYFEANLYHLRQENIKSKTKIMNSMFNGDWSNIENTVQFSVMMK